MARIVCQVLHRPERLTFIWSQGSASFPPYHLRGDKAEAFRQLTRQAHERLADVSQPGSLTALAHVGWQLIQAIFPADSVGAEVRTWLADLHGKGAVDALEMVSDIPGSIPWNVLYEAAPDERGLAEGQADAVGHFWGVRYPISSGRRVNTWRHVPALERPNVLLAIDPALRDSLPEDQRNRLREFADGKALRAVESRSALETALAEPTDFLYVLCRAQSHGLMLGEDLLGWSALRDVVQSGDNEPLVYLNLCRVGAVEQAEPCVQRLLAMGLDGLIATEYAGPAAAGNALGLDILSSFLFGGERLGTVLQKARSRAGAAGLLVTSSGPAHLRVVWDETADVEEPPDSPPPGPLPENPYRPLTPYDREDRALFAGRDEDVADFVSQLDRADTRLLVLHGLSGVGKSSFLHAGAVPYLEDEAVGFLALRDRTAEETPVAERDYPVIAVRASHDLAGQMAEALCAFCSQAYHFAAPNGKTPSLDLPGILRKLTGDDNAAATSTAVRELAARDQIQTSSTGLPPLLETDGESSKAEKGELVTADVLWGALQNDAGLLARILAEISDGLPGELVILVEQGEEIFTQARRPVDQRRRRLALEMLARVAGSPVRCKLIYAMRTEYLGRLLDDFPRQEQAPRTFLLPEIDEDAVLQAITSPTIAESVPYADEIPFEKYGFTFAAGVPQALIRNVRETANGVYLLPRVQAICAELYQSVSSRSERVVTQADLNLLAKGEAAFQLGQYVEKSLTSLHRSDRRRFMDLCQQLYRREADGTVVRSLVPYGDFAADWRGSVPADAVVETAAAENVRVLELNQLLIGGKESLYVSLSHDALAQTARQWSEETKRAVYGRGKMIDMLWIFIPLMFLIAVIVYVIMRPAAGEGPLTTEEAKKFFSDNFPKQFLSLFPKHAEDTLGYPLYVGRMSQAEQARQSGDTLRMRQALLSQQNEEKDLRGFEWFYLWGQAMQQRKEMLGHKGLITSVAVSADGKTFASASLDGTVKLCDASGVIRATFEGNGGPVHAVAFSPDGKTVATGGADKLVQFWDVPAGNNYVVVKKAGKTLTGHTDAVLTLAFTPDKARLASGSADKTIIIWDVAKNQKQSELKEHAGPVLAVAVAPDGKTLASAGDDRVVHLWEIASGKKQQTLQGHGGPVFALAFSPDGDRLASGGVDIKENVEVGTIRLWDAKTGKATGDPIQHSVGTFALAFGPGGKTLFTAGKDSLIRVWDPSTGSDLGTMRGHLGWVRTLALTADGGTLVSGSYDQSVKIWSPASALGQADVLRGHKDWVCAVAFSADDRIVASAGRDGTVKLWDAANGTELQTLAGLGGPVLSLAFSPAKGAPKLAAGVWNDKGAGEIKVWELLSKKGQAGIEAREIHVLKGHQGGIACLAFSRDGRSLASGSEDKFAILWDVATGKPKKTIKGHTAGIRALSLSFDGNLLATGGDDKLIHIWDTSTGKDKQAPIMAHTAPITALAFFPDGWLISAAYDQTIRFWKDGATGGMLRGHSNAILSLAIAGHVPGGKEIGPELIFSGSWDNTIKVWGLRPGTDERFTFRGHTGPVRGLALSNDRRTLASASHDGTVRLWRAADSSAFRKQHR